MKRCQHPRYADGHCAENSCFYYWGACPRHAASGQRTASCRLIKATVPA